MRVNTNVNSLVAMRNLGNANAQVTDSIGKLSTGFRINRAADDAAGLGIANKLRADNRALTQASRNAEQGNSVLQIAEGSTSTIQKMLERMKELATQAGSDSVDVDGRARINEEFTQLRAEITRTVDTTKFQGGHLLKTVAYAAAVPPTNASSATGTALAGANAGIASITVTNQAPAGSYRIWNDSGTVRLQQETAPNTWTDRATGAAGDTLNYAAGGLSVVLASDISAIATTDSAAHAFSVTGYDAGSPEVQASGGPRSFLVGSSGAYTSDDLITIDGLDLAVTTLGIDGDDLLTASAARDALTNIDSAIATVSESLGKIGASQNRMQYAQDNLKATIMNMSAAESVIRDLDMADEMSKFSKNNIISQAATAMLAQANQSTQGVLQLLRG